MHNFYARTLAWVLRHPRAILAVAVLTVAVNVYLFVVVPKGFFPQQDTGRITGMVQAAQDISFQSMREKLGRIVEIIRSDPAVENVIGFTGGGGGGSGTTTNTARMFIALKPLAERKLSADEVIGRLRQRLTGVVGAPTYLQAVQDLRVGGRASNAQYQFTLQGDSIADLNAWAPQIVQRLRGLRQVVDIGSDQQDRGQQASVVIDRSTASRFGITSQRIDDTLYDAFGQRQVSVVYTLLNQYHVVMEVEPKYWQRPETLRDIYLPGSGGAMVPLSALARYTPTNTALAVNHQSQFPSVTVSFNLPPGVALGEAVTAIQDATPGAGLPPAIRGSFQGTAPAV